MGWIRRILSRCLWKMDHKTVATEHTEETYSKETMEIGEDIHRCKMTAAVQAHEACLSAVIGLDDFKDYYRCLARQNLFKENREDSGCETIPISIAPMLFIGNRGTGKSMAAEMLGRLHCTKVYEVQLNELLAPRNTLRSDFTKDNTKMAMQQSRDGTMVVNGVQRLGYDNMILVALREIKNLMSEYNINPIFTATRDLSEDDLNQIREIFGERIKVFEFVDYSDKDLAQMVQAKMNDRGEKNPCKGLRLHPDCTVDAISKLIKKKTSKKQRCMNGFLVDVILENARISLDARVGLDATGKELLTISLEDLEKGLNSIQLLYP